MPLLSEIPVYICHDIYIVTILQDSASPSKRSVVQFSVFSDIAVSLMGVMIVGAHGAILSIHVTVPVIVLSKSILFIQR